MAEALFNIRYSHRIAGGSQQFTIFTINHESVRVVPLNCSTKYENVLVSFSDLLKVAWS
jgi:hypothetical protein